MIQIIAKRLEKDVAFEFYNQKLNSACLAQSFIIKYILSPMSKSDIKIIRGFIVMGCMYWGHFWVEK